MALILVRSGFLSAFSVYGVVWLETVCSVGSISCEVRCYELVCYIVRYDVTNDMLYVEVVNGFSPKWLFPIGIYVIVSLFYMAQKTLLHGPFSHGT